MVSYPGDSQAAPHHQARVLCGRINLWSALVLSHTIYFLTLDLFAHMKHASSVSIDPKPSALTSTETLGPHGATPEVGQDDTISKDFGFWLFLDGIVTIPDILLTLVYY